MFDDRDEEERRRDATYRIVRPKRDSISPESEVPSTVFVKNRGRSSDRVEKSAKQGWVEMFVFIAAAVLMVLGLILGWYWIR